MKYRLKVKYTNKVWKLGINMYDSIEKANERVNELKKVGIKSIVVDELGGKLNV